jgi:multidrug efflux pump
VRYTGKDVDIFVQIGLVVLVGLASKNAILIVEFASQLRREGWSRKDATVEASRLRVRPILMTSFAFILGVVPLVVAHGAGAEMRRSLGTAVFSGMLGVTVFGIFLTPVFFYVLQGVDESAALAGTALQWIVSIVLGGLVGAAIGYLLARVVDLLPIWSMILGASAGITGAALLLEIRRRMGPSPARGRVIEHAGLSTPPESGDTPR